MQFREFNDIKLENAQSSKLESKTEGAKLYNVKLCELEVGIIDTPGFGDTRGLEEDKKHTEKIVEALKEEEYINCVCLVINGRQCRMSATLRYVLTEIGSILPRKVLENVVVVFTNTTDILDLNFDPISLREYFGGEIQPSRLFFTENPYCKYEKAKQMEGQQSPENIERILKNSFDKATEMLMQMWDNIKDFSRVHTHYFIVLYQKKQEIQKKLMDLLASYDYQTELEMKIKHTEEEVDAALRAKNLNANFKSTQTLPAKWKPVETQRHNTLCGAKGCYSNCHEPCDLPKSFEIEDFKKCWCIHNSETGVDCCQCGHPYSLHYHNEVRWEEEKETKKLVIDDETKEKFDKAKSMEEKARIVKQKLEHDKTKSEQEREMLSECFLKTVQEFQTLGINRNYLKLLENQLAMIKHRLEGANGQETQDLRKTKVKLEKEIWLVQKTLPESDVDVPVKLKRAYSSLDAETPATYRTEQFSTTMLLFTLLVVLLLLFLLLYTYWCYSDHSTGRQLIENLS